MRESLGIVSAVGGSLLLALSILLLAWFGMTQIETGVQPPPTADLPSWIGHAMAAVAASIALGSILTCRRAVHLHGSDVAFQSFTEYPPSRYDHVARRTFYAILRIELACGVALAALGVPTFYNYVQTFATRAAGRDEQVFGGAELLGAALGIGIAIALIAAVRNRPHLIVLYLTLAVPDSEQADEADNFESRFYGSKRWLNPTHQGLWEIARALERHAVGYVHRLTPEQLAIVEQAHLKLSHRLRSIGVTAVVEGESVRKALSAAAALVVTDDPVGTSQRVMDQLDLANEPAIRTQGWMSAQLDRVSRAGQRIAPAGKFLLLAAAVVLVVYTDDIPGIVEALLSVAGR